MKKVIILLISCTGIMIVTDATAMFTRAYQMGRGRVAGVAGVAGVRPYSYRRIMPLIKPHSTQNNNLSPEELQVASDLLYKEYEDSKDKLRLSKKGLLREKDYYEKYEDSSDVEPQPTFHDLEVDTDEVDTDDDKFSPWSRAQLAAQLEEDFNKLPVWQRLLKSSAYERAIESLKK